MDRTDEFLKIGAIHQHGEAVKHQVVLSPFTMTALNTAANLEQNEALLKKMQRLTSQKEFSNDPALAIEEISNVFNTSISSIKFELTLLKKESEGDRKAGHNAAHKKIVLEFLARSMTSQAESFQNAIKTHLSHVEARNKRVEKYGSSSGSVLASSNSSSKGGDVSGAVDTQKYAMFGGRTAESSSGSHFNHELRNRRLGLLSRESDATVAVSNSNNNSSSGTDFVSEEPADRPSQQVDDHPPSNNLYSSAHSSVVGGGFGKGFVDAPPPDDDKYNKQPPPAPLSSGSAGANPHLRGTTYNHNRLSTARSSSSSNSSLRTRNSVSGAASPYDSQQQQQQQQFTRVKDTSRVRGAERVEASIAQMGQMFAQIAALVSDQGAQIDRIEDDVEAGLSETKAANESMQQLYNITKGNRGLILKIFGLLVFFIFLFLYWT